MTPEPINEDDEEQEREPKFSVQIAGSGDNSVRLKVHGDVVYMNEDDATRVGLLLLRAVNGGSILLDAYSRGHEARIEYGDPKPNMEATGDLIGNYLGTEIDGFDAALTMVLLKTARLQTGQRKRDTLVDIAGYARVAAEVEGLNNDE